MLKQTMLIDMKKKIGRNDPCPCGSGKKYKKCCLGRDGRAANKFPPEIEMNPYERLAILRFGEELRERPELLKMISDKVKSTKNGENLPTRESFDEFVSGMWTSEKLEAMSTDAIIAKLTIMGVKFEEQLFRQQVRDYICAIQLAEDHYYTQNWHAPGQDEDFIWLAITELWQRLIPERLNVEMIDDLIMDGYDDIRNGFDEDAFDKWEKAWNMLKRMIPTTIRSVEKADQFAGKQLEQSLSNWCQDFADLKIDGLEDSVYEKRISFCQDFLTVFPDSDESVIQSILAGEAECYAFTGIIKAADKVFEDLIARDPKNAWGYIRWGNLYCEFAGLQNDFKTETKFPVDYNKAEQIYRLGLAKCTVNVDNLKKRLKELETEKAENGS